jgi:hypothetical protein
VKTAIIVAMILATAIISPASAGSGIKIEVPCGSKCAAPQPAPQANAPMIGIRFSKGDEFTGGMTTGPDYVSRSQTVIRSRYGTSVINSTYRSYRR